MNTEDMPKRIDRFERTVATCLCVVPLLFSAQCVLVALSAPTFAAMFADFGAKLPWPTQFILDTWGLWAAFGGIAPIISFTVARKGEPNLSVIISTILGVTTFLIAQLITVALLLPIFQLGAVSTGP